MPSILIKIYNSISITPDTESIVTALYINSTPIQVVLLFRVAVIDLSMLHFFAQFIICIVCRIDKLGTSFADKTLLALTFQLLSVSMYLFIYLFIFCKGFAAIGSSINHCRLSPEHICDILYTYSLAIMITNAATPFKS